MALTNNPLRIIDVALYLRESINDPISTDLGTNFKHPNVNRWSKIKPQIDSRVVKNEPNFWRRSDVGDNIRCGLNIQNNSGSVWEYPRERINCPSRLDDFRGYDKNASLLMDLDLPNTISLESDYTSTFIFNAYASDTSVALHDLFDLENKYCCFVVEMRAGNKFVRAQSPRLVYQSFGEYYGQQVTIPEVDMETIIAQGGTITIETFFVEADDYFVATGLSNPKMFSLRALEEIQTLHYNSQFLAQGFIVYSNFDTIQPTKSGLSITSSGYETVAVSASQSTGGLFSNYWFQAKVLGGGTLGLPYAFELPTHSLTTGQSHLMSVPSFSLELLEDKEVILEYSVWNGVPEQGQLVLSKTYKL